MQNEHKPQSEERAILSRARSAVGDPLYDPEQAIKFLLEQAEQGLSRRADALSTSYKRIHLRLVMHAERSKAAKEATNHPRHVELEALHERGNRGLAELHELLQRSERASKQEKSVLLGQAKSKIKKLENIREKMEITISPLTESLKRMESEIAIAAPLWASIQGAENVAMSLRWSIRWASMQSFILRTAFLAIAFSIAFAVDRYTNFAEANLVTITAANRHDVAISLLFFAQSIIFELSFSKLKRAFLSRLQARITKRAEDLLMRIEEYEQQMTQADGALGKLEASSN